MLKVVIVEDEELVRKGIVLTVDWTSFDCVVVGEATNGREGFEVIEKLRPDLVITDVRMPAMDGVEMIRLLREKGNEAHFIILTAYSDFTYAHKALKLGVSDYLLKPFTDKDLQEALLRVHQSIEQKHGQAEGKEAPLIRFNLEKGDKSKYVEQAVQYIRENYANPEISVGMVAEHLAISEGYLSRMFKKETDYTFVSYLTNYRIHTAMGLLKDYRMKVYEVADKVGYADTTYFSTLFKKLVGISPSEFQDRCN